MVGTESTPAAESGWMGPKSEGMELAESWFPKF